MCTCVYVFICLTYLLAYVGPLCEEIKLCDPNPCLNGGTCVERTGLEYVCECPTNFIGSNCSSCQNGFGLADGYCGKSSS